MVNFILCFLLLMTENNGLPGSIIGLYIFPLSMLYAIIEFNYSYITAIVKENFFHFSFHMEVSLLFFFFFLSLQGFKIVCCLFLETKLLFTGYFVLLPQGFFFQPKVILPT